MHRTAIVAAFLFAAMGAPAFAQDGRFYIGGNLGAAFSTETDQDYTPGATVGSTGNISTDHELGLAASAFVGYDFGAFRVEAEAGYLSAGVDELSSSFTAGALTAGSQSADGDVSAQSYMANALVDISGFGDLTFFVGGGLGVAKLKISELRPSGGFVVLDDEDSDWHSAWQGFVGVRKPLSGNMNGHIRYRYFNVDDAEMVGFQGRAVTAGLTSHSVEAGVTFTF